MKRLVAFALLLTACRSVGHEPALSVAVAPTPPPRVVGAIPVAGEPMAHRHPLPFEPVSGDFTQKDVAFTSGETLPELRIHYLTLGTLKRDAAGRATNAVLILHGTTGSGAGFTGATFADAVFGPGQVLDLARYYVILPDAIGHGASSKPSDGLHARFPRYGYADMVEAEHALVTAGLNVDHLVLVMGTSMGCMHSWLWAERWPSAMDAVLGLACLPAPIAGRNRAWRKMVIDGIKDDPAWNGGEYAAEPRAGLESAAHLFAIADSAPLADQKRLPTADAADRDVEDDARRFVATHDANDVLYAVASSRDYDPSADLEKITAPLLLVNTADDFINPPELEIAERELKRVKRGRFVLVPASESTHGHGTYLFGASWAKELGTLLAEASRSRR